MKYTRMFAGPLLFAMSFSPVFADGTSNTGVTVAQAYDMSWQPILSFSQFSDLVYLYMEGKQIGVNEAIAAVVEEFNLN